MPASRIGVYFWHFWTNSYIMLSALTHIFALQTVSVTNMVSSKYIYMDYSCSVVVRRYRHYAPQIF